MARLAPAVLAACALTGCGDSSQTPAERVDRAAEPPAGWRTVRNATAGFTVATPRRWRAAQKASTSLLRSPDRLVAVTVAADRTAEGRDTPPAQYAREVIGALPEFEGDLSATGRRVPGSPYSSAVISATGSLSTSRRAQRISVAVFQRRGVVTVAAVVFRSGRARESLGARTVARILRTLRIQRPRADQRSGRSG